MTTSIPKSTNEILFACIGVITFLLCFGLTLWAYRHYKLRGFYLNDYRKLILEARSLSAETLRVKREVEHDISADKVTRSKNREILRTAEDWDNGIRMALTAWEDVMQTATSSSSSSSSKKGPTSDTDDEKDCEANIETKDAGHGRYIIGIMRAKCIEGIERRKEVSLQMATMVADVRARRVEQLMSRLNSKGPVVVEQKSKPGGKDNVTVKTRPLRPALNQLHCASFDELYNDDRKVVPPPRRAMSCAPGEDRKTAGDKLNGLCIYI